jgi:hypothetical protein
LCFIVVDEVVPAEQPPPIMVSVDWQDTVTLEFSAEVEVLRCVQLVKPPETETVPQDQVEPSQRIA